jgi:hypothetical protein
MARSKAITCNSCEMLSINGCAMHEHNCPNTNAIWDREQREWVRVRTCFECGCVVESGTECCDA